MRSCPGNPKNILYIYVLFDEAPQHPPTPPRHMSIPHFDKKKELNDVQSLVVKTQTQPQLNPHELSFGNISAVTGLILTKL